MSEVFINIPSGGSRTWKDPVANAAALPASNNNDGDVRATLDTHSIYIWDGAGWVLISSGTGGLNSITVVGPLVDTGTITDPVLSINSTNNTVAGFGNTGNLESIPGFTIDTVSGGMFENLTEQPNNLTGGYTANNLNVNFSPLQNSPDDDWNIQTIEANFDVDNSGFSQGTNGEALTLLNLNVTNANTGPIGGTSLIKSYYNLGNGTDPLTIKGLGYFFGFADINNNVTLDGQIQGFDFQPHIHSGTISTSNFNMYAFGDFANVEVATNAYTSANFSPNILSINNGNNYNGAVVTPNIPTLTGSASLYGFGFYPTVSTVGNTGQIVGVNMNPTIGTLGTNGNYNAVSVGGGITTMGSNSNLSGFDWHPTVTTSHGNINGIQLSPTIGGGDAGFTGLNISPNGGATLTNPVALRISMNQINSSDPQGTTGIESDSRLQINANTQLKAAQGFQIGSRIEHSFSVPNGSPVTGTDEIGVNIAGDFIVEDNVANGGIGLGFNSVGFISSLAVAATKTVDTITVFLPASALPDPGFTTGGNVTDFHMIRTFPPLGQGGTLNITNLYGFKIDSGFGNFSSAATNAWGLYLDDASLGNYIGGNIAIGTPSKKVSNSDVALEIGSKKAFMPGQVTTVEKLLLVAVPGMQVYDTTLNQMSYYNGTTWINF